MAKYSVTILVQASGGRPVYYSMLRKVYDINAPVRKAAELIAIRKAKKEFGTYSVRVER